MKIGNEKVGTNRTYLYSIALLNCYIIKQNHEKLLSIKQAI